MYQMVISSEGTTMVALRNSLASGVNEVLEHGHAIAAQKGLPFECHYLELPLILTNPGFGGTPSAARCAVTSAISMWPQQCDQYGATLVHAQRERCRRSGLLDRHACNICFKGTVW
jgi:hypothetical protein